MHDPTLYPIANAFFLITYIIYCTHSYLCPITHILLHPSVYPMMCKLPHYIHSSTHIPHCTCGTTHTRRPSPVLRDRAIQIHRFEPWSCQTNDLKIDSCRFLARCSVLSGEGKDWLVQCHDNAAELDIRSWCWRPDLPVGQHYKVAMSAHCHKSVAILMLLGRKITRNTQLVRLGCELNPRPPTCEASALHHRKEVSSLSAFGKY